MKTTDNEIKFSGVTNRHPYQVPEGYFEDFQAKMSRMARTQKTVPVSTWMRVKPYVGLAASFLLLMGVGSLFLQKVTPVQDDEAAMALYDELIPRSDEDALWLADNQETELSNEDIADYLDAIGTSIEDLYTEWL